MLGVILFGYVESFHSALLPESVHRYADEITIVILVVLLLFSYGFNQLKPFYMGVHLAIVFAWQQLAALNETAAFDWMTVLLPIHLIALFFMKNGAVFSFQGKLYGAVLLVQFLLLIIADQSNWSHLIQEALSNADERLPEFPGALSSLSVLLFAGAMIAMITGIVFGFTFEKVMLLGTACCLVFSLYINETTLETDFFILAGGILLLLSIVSDTYAMAYRDELTNIPARRKLMEDGMKLGSKYSLAMIDIDFFKKINDRHGHDAGDEVLKIVARCLNSVKGGGKAYRYGGEEFTVVFTRKKIDDAAEFLEQLREKVSKQTYAYKKKNRQGETKLQKIKVTISIGVAERNANHKTLEEVIKAADKALYQAKKQGRNRVVQAK